MSISKHCFDALQQAGQSVFAARQEFAKEVQANTAKTVQLLASAPFGHEADRAYANLRAVARLAQDLEAIEDRLKSIYISTDEIMREQAQQTPVVVLSLPPASKSPRAEQNATADDATPRRPTPKRPTSPAAENKAVLAFLRNHLSSTAWKRVAVADVAKSTDIPKARVEQALAELAATGKIASKGRGLYRLAA